MSVVRRTLRVVLTGTVLVVALVLVAYLAVNLLGLVAAQGTRDRVSEAVSERLVEEVPTVRDRSEALAGRVDAEPSHHWVAQACHFTSTDSGWIVQSHRQVCDAEALVAWPVDSRREAEMLVADLRPPDRSSYRSGSCLSFGVDGDFGGERQQFVHVAPGGDRTDRWCVPAEDGYPSRRAVMEEVADLDPDQGWLLLLTLAPLVDEDIGCLHWSVVFCDNPFGDELAWGRAPG
jgi:hypothetical protein